MVRTKDKLGGNVMDNKEAIQLLDKLLLRGNFTELYGSSPYKEVIEEAIEIARQAIKKQIPKKLNHKTTRYVIQGLELSNDCIYCPLCNNFIDRISDYCPDCGQALDWSSENE